MASSSPFSPVIVTHSSMDEGALEERLRSLLSEGLDHALRPTDESHHHQQRLARRLEIASSVYSSWTGKENDASKLASKIADGSVDNLRSFVTEKDEDDGVEATSTVTVEVRDAEDLSYEEFWLRYMFENKPVLVSHIGREWRATREWTDHNGALSLGALSEAFGDAQVWVTHCTSTAEKSAGERERWTVREYIENYWRKDEGDRGNRSLYLKDWHFPTEFADYGAYETPKYFRDDWLNEYYDHLASNAGPGGAGDKTDQQALECSDYRFLYMGPKGTKTGLHADVLRSFSWSINISGRKVSSLQTPPFHTDWLALTEPPHPLSPFRFQEMVSSPTPVHPPPVRHLRAQHRTGLLRGGRGSLPKRRGGEEVPRGGGPGCGGGDLCAQWVAPHRGESRGHPEHKS